MLYRNFSRDVIEKVKKNENKCTSCKKCMKHCPMLSAHCNTPKQLLGDILEKGEIDIEIPFSCTLCGYCTSVCKEQVTLNHVFLEMKREVVSKVGYPKQFGKMALNFHQGNSFSSVFSTSINKDRKSKRIFFPGCSFSSYNPDLVERVYRYLKKQYDIDIALKCCACPTYSTGNVKKYEKLNRKIVDDFKKLGVEEIIVLCMNCYKMLKNDTSFKIKTIWEELDRFGLDEDVIKIDTRFTLHDPCPTRFEPHIQEAVRNVIKNIGLDIKEFEQTKENTLCCGSGAMFKLVNHRRAKEHTKKRVAQTGSEYILTYCEECVETIRWGGKKAIHLLDIIFESKYNKVFNQRTQSTAKKWMNRYVAKKKVDFLRKGR